MPAATEQAGATGRGRSLDGWRRCAAGGVIVTGVALGLRQALGEHGEPPLLVIEAPEEPPPRDQAVEVHFDPAGPAHTWVVLRPWLLEAAT